MPDNRARIWFSVFVLAVFCLGGGVGLFVGWHVPPPRAHGFLGLHAGPPPGGPGPWDGRGPMPAMPPPEMLRRIEDDLQLDATQRQQVEKLMDERRDRLEAIHREARDKFNREARGLHEEIRAILRPDQQLKFDRFLEHHRP
jgi:hypothetical protein